MISKRLLLSLSSLSYLLYNNHISPKTLLFFSASIISGGLFLLYLKQDSLLYIPKIHPLYITPKSNPPLFRSPSEHGLPYENLYLQTPDNETLHAWFIRSDDRKHRPTILFLHANAANMGFRLENVKAMYHRLNANVFILSYRGYGESSGTPSETGLKIDVETALLYLKQRDDIDQEKICVFGRSLGGACAIYLAAKYSEVIACTVVENSFSSIDEMVGSIFWFLNFRILKKLILRIEWNSLGVVDQIKHPILFIGGKLDEIVPHSQLLSLYNSAVNSRNRQLYIVEEGKHNDTHLRGGEMYWKKFQEFIDKSTEQKLDKFSNEEGQNDESHQSKM